MKIIETDFKWGGGLTNRPQTLYIALHHRAGDGDAESIHKQHQNQGWSGIGYHFYIRKDGSIYRGRPIDKMGAHITGYNSCAIGICFEGNYHTENAVMPTAQIKAGQELVSYLKGLYPNARVVGHRDLQATACPGDYFPFEEIINYAIESEDEDMVIYNTEKECPMWAQNYIKKAIELGWIKGDENGRLNLDDTKIWVLVVLLRSQEIMK